MELGKDKVGRILAIYSKLMDGQIVNKTEEALCFNVNERSIQRDIDDIRNFLEQEAVEQGVFNDVIYDREKKGYRLDQIYKIKLSDDEILAVCKILLDSRAFKKEEMLSMIHRLIACCVPEENKDVDDNEIEAVNCDLEAIGSECQYTEENEYHDLRSYFMELRLRMIFLDNQDFVRMKLRTLLRVHGYKRRTAKLNIYLKQCMYFYHIETYVRGRERCDIEEIGLDDMITFRVLGNIRGMHSRLRSWC